MTRIRRALVSVSDKADLVPFVRGLRQLGIQILSTGGTAKLLKRNGIPVQEIAEFTGFPEILGGRVKTLHPKVHGAILARREDPAQMRQARRLGLKPIDLVVVNLYPFEAAVRRKRARLSDWIEQIDIGGVALLRSAAKNFQSVGVICRPSQYGEVLKELDRSKGVLPERVRRRLALEAFSETACYDSLIHQALGHRQDKGGGWRVKGEGKSRTDWPERLVLGASRRQILRYGENPHQSGAWYQWPALSPAEGPALDGAGLGLAAARQLHGKELSYNNLLDLDAALGMVSSFRKPCAVVVKHANPAGAACAGTPREAFRRAFEADPLSAFGGIVGFNRPVDGATACAIAESGFLECLIAPGYSQRALRILQKKRNLRILEIPASEVKPVPRCMEVRQIRGGLLVQQPDDALQGPAGWRCVTRARPSPAQRRDLAFAWAVAKFVRSNAIVVASGERTVGIGAGQTSRVDSVRVALEKAGPRARGAVLASDGFFPKPDGPAAAARAGIRAIVQPGGSVQDPEVIRAADRARIAMLLTGERHFRH